MSIDQEVMQRIHNLVKEDKDLQARVLVADSGAALAELLARETSARGWSVDAAELEREFAQLAERHGAAALSDSQLEAVAGGIDSWGFAIASGVSLWIACAVMSADNEIITDLNRDGNRVGAKELGWC